MIPVGTPEPDSPYEETGRLAAARGELFRFLALQLVVRPSAQRAEPADLWTAWEQNAGALEGEHLESLRVYLHSRECSMTELDEEFTTLFVIPTRGRYLAPVESAYRSGDNGSTSWSPSSLRGPCYHAALSSYRSLGFTQPFGTELEADHLGCELAFLGFLCDIEASAWRARSIDAARAARAEQRAFAQRHPLRWIAALRRRFSAASSEPYYDVALTVAEEFLHLEVAQLMETEGTF